MFMRTYPSLRTTKIHRGILSIEMVIILAVLAIAAITIFLNAGSLFGKNDTSTEMANSQEIAINTRSLLKNGGIYDFNSAADMTGVLIKFGGVPKSMTIVGDASSGTATVINTWGGAVTVEPTASTGGKTGFSVTYEKVPMTACTAMSSKLSQSFGETSINATKTVGLVNASSASTQCTKDNGSTGTNTLKFTSLT